jgi:hypothetical protein
MGPLEFIGGNYQMVSQTGGTQMFLAGIGLAAIIGIAIAIAIVPVKYRTPQ